MRLATAPISSDAPDVADYGPCLSPAIWVVDDRPSARLFLQNSFRFCHTQSPVSFFSSGAEVLARLRDAFPPRVLLLNLEPAGLDAIETLRRLNAWGFLESTAVVVFSSRSDRTTIATVYNLGAFLCVQKPENREDYVGLALLSELCSGASPPEAIAFQPFASRALPIAEALSLLRNRHRDAYISARAREPFPAEPFQLAALQVSASL